jgi:hypothetical protein
MMICLLGIVALLVAFYAVMIIVSVNRFRRVSDFIRTGLRRDSR